ncbi:MAG: LOG family protein, partial [Candidatus Omnitrophica bacterium]|nr:LOG family protein [Candidatus Omnitrophota bacterium]
GITRLSHLPNAVTIIGKLSANGFTTNDPEKMEEINYYLDKLEEIVRELVARGAYIRVASRGPVFERVRRVMAELGQEDRLQVVLFRHWNDINWNTEELQFKDNFPNNAVFVHEDSIHQILTTYGSRGYLVLPGALGTFNKAFDIIGAMQTKTIRVKPMVYLGDSFYGRIKRALRQSMENHNPPTVSKGDWELMKVTEEASQALVMLGFVKPQLDDLDVLGVASSDAGGAATLIIKQSEPGKDEALIVVADNQNGADAVGGIDLTPVDIRIEGDGQPLVIPMAGLDFYMFENISGFTPVVVEIVPLTDPQTYLQTATTRPRKDVALVVK